MALYDALQAAARRRRPFEQGDYTASLRALAVLKAPVDAFFDSVMVNADDLPEGQPPGPTCLAASGHESGRRHFPTGGLICFRVHPEGMKLVILDRDGTINHEREDYIKSSDSGIAPLPGRWRPSRASIMRGGM